MRSFWSLVAALAMLAVAALASAADWAASVFPERSHNFGTVARGSKVRHSFPVINSTSEVVHILSYQTLCGCTDVRLGAKEIPPGTQTVIEATIDTTRFEGHKPSGLILNIDRPTPVEIRLGLECFIQSDLTLNPGQVDFGVVNRVAGAQADLNLAYAGAQPGWAITGASTISDHIVAQLDAQPRGPGGPLVYRLAVKLRPATPVGHFKDEITLRTNDPNAPTIPVSVAAVVQSNVTVAPSVINLGTVRPGETVQRTFVVRSAQPFKVVAADSKQPEIAVAATPDLARPLHSMTFTFKAPATPGAYNAPIEIRTDVKDEPPARLMTFATIVP